MIIIFEKIKCLADNKHLLRNKLNSKSSSNVSKDVDLHKQKKKKKKKRESVNDI